MYLLINISIGYVPVIDVSFFFWWVGGGECDPLTVFSILLADTCSLKKLGVVVCSTCFERAIACIVPLMYIRSSASPGRLFFSYYG